MPYEQWTRKNAALVLDSIADVILTTDSEATVLYANKAAGAMFGVESAELLGRRIDRLVPSAGDSARSGEPETRSFESYGLRPDGAHFPLQCTVNQLETEEGAHYAVVVRDLTHEHDQQISLHAQRDLLARAGRLSTLGEMTASIAHEINQPLTAIAMYAQSCQRLLDQEPTDIARLTEALQRLSEQALRAGSISERVQHFVSRRHEPRGAHNLNELLLDLEPLAVADARICGVSLRYELAAELPMVFCSAINIQQVMLNLLRNAFDAMSLEEAAQEAAVVVYSDELSTGEGSVIKISVEDRGPGIDKKLEPRLFDPFRTTKKSGVGLGLSTCRTLISDEGGSLGYENRPGAGATFWFTLPVVTRSHND